MVVTRSPQPRTGLFWVRHRVFQQALSAYLRCVLSLGTWWPRLGVARVNNWMTGSSEALGTTATSTPSLELS